MQPHTLLSVISNLLYEKRSVHMSVCQPITVYRRFGPYFVEPLVAGLDANNEPFVASTDLIGW